MKVLGVEPGALNLQWIMLEGDASGGAAIHCDPMKISVPNSEADDISNLLRMKEILKVHFLKFQPDRIAVIRATDSMTSVARAKLEFVLQMAAKEANLECTLVAPQSVTKESKKYPISDAKRLETIYFKGSEIEPKYLLKAAYCAWQLIRKSHGT